MKTLLLWALTGCMVCLPARAHHGTSNYTGVTETITLEGTVTEFAWSNPHVFVLFDVKDDKGNTAHWAGEMNSPGVLKAAGWSKTTLKAGDQIKVGSITQSERLAKYNRLLEIEWETKLPVVDWP